MTEMLFQANEIEEFRAAMCPGRSSMRPGEIIGMKRAEDLARKDSKTIVSWCQGFGIGVHSCASAPWEISAPALLMVKRGYYCA